MREALLLGAEGFGVVVAAAVDEARGVFDVEHLVIEDVLDEPFGHVRGVQSLADDDGFVDSVVVAEDGARAALRPGERRPLDLPVEVPAVETSEHPREVVVATLRAGDHLPPAVAAREVGGAQGFGREGVVAVNLFVEDRRAASQEFGDEDEGQRLVDVERGVLENVREAHVDAARTESDGVVEPGVRVVAHVNFGHGTPGRELPEGLHEERAEQRRCVGHKFGKPLSGVRR